jgi:hypothetical protein
MLSERELVRVAEVAQAWLFFFFVEADRVAVEFSKVNAPVYSS